MIWDLVRDVRARGKTVVLTTHYMEEVEHLCDRVAILDRGRIVALDTPATLIDSLDGEQRVIFSLAGGPSPALTQALAKIGRVEFQGEQVTISGKDDHTLASTLPTARTAQIVAMVLLYPMLILSGAGWSRELMPGGFVKIPAFLPLAYVVNLLRGLWVGEPWSQHITDALVLVGFLIVGVLISIKTFRWE